MRVSAHLDVPPARVVVEAQVHIVLQRDRQPVHEGRSGGDGVAVKYLAALLLGNQDALLGKLLTQPLLLSFLQKVRRKRVTRREVRRDEGRGGRRT